MKIILLLVAIMLLVAGGAEARYSPGLEIAEGGDIMLDGGHIIDFSSTDFINIKEFGAVGDNTTDDTDAIQAAIDSTGGGPATVYFPNGTYNFTTLTLHSGVVLIGSGWSGWYAIDEGSLLVHKSNTTSAAIVWDNTGGAEGDSYLAIRDLGIIGDMVSTGHGIYIKSGYNYYIENCMISGFVGANIYMDTCGTGYVQNNRIYYAKNNSSWAVGGAGMYALNCGDFHFDGNDIGNAADDMDKCHGIYLPGSSGQLTRNKIFQSKWGIYTGSGIIATANWLNDLYEYGIFLTADDSIVSGNLIQNISSGPFSATWVGIATSPAATNNTIIGNRIIVSEGLAGIYINGGQQTIEGNNCNLPIHWPRVAYMDDIPTTGYWARGSVVWFTDAAASQPPGAVCVSAGTPGTWKNMAKLI